MIYHTYNLFYMVSHDGNKFLAVMDDYGNLVQTSLDHLNIFFTA